MTSLRDLDVRHLDALVAVADEGTFAKAAGRLGFTQSAISQQIASLERLVGMPLFDRPKGPRPAELTPAGALLLDHARGVLTRLERAGEALEELRRGGHGRLVVGTFQSVSAKVLPHVVGRVRRERPELDVRLHESDSNDDLVSALLDDELDLAFLVDDGGLDPRLALAFLAFDPYVLLAPAAEGAAGGSEPLASLDGAELVGQPEGNPCQLLVERAFAEHGISPMWVFRSVDNGAVQAMVRSGVGRAVMPYLAVEPDDPGIVLSSLAPPIPARRIVVARRAGRTLHPAADDLVRHAQAVCTELAPPKENAPAEPEEAASAEG